jgi:hypothetical protein
MKINQAGKIGTMAIALALGGCGNRAQDALALRIELTALKQELELVRLQTEDLDPRVRLAEQMAMQVFDEREAPARPVRAAAASRCEPLARAGRVEDDRRRLRRTGPRIGARPRRQGERGGDRARPQVSRRERFVPAGKHCRTRGAAATPGRVV